jgi:hypothetical protein
MSFNLLIAAIKISFIISVLKTKKNVNVNIFSIYCLIFFEKVFGRKKYIVHTAKALKLATPVLVERLMENVDNFFCAYE